MRQLAEVSPTVVNGGDGMVQTRRGDAEPGDVQLQTVHGAALGEDHVLQALRAEISGLEKRIDEFAVEEPVASGVVATAMPAAARGLQTVINADASWMETKIPAAPVLGNNYPAGTAMKASWEVDPSKQKIHLRPIEAIFKEFNPAGEKGLSSSRAKELLEIHGPNELEKPPRISLFMLSSSSSTL